MIVRNKLVDLRLHTHTVTTKSATDCPACARVKNIVKVHCNLRLVVVDNAEEIVRSDANIEWCSDEDLQGLTDWR